MQYILSYIYIFRPSYVPHTVLIHSRCRTLNAGALNKQLAGFTMEN